MISSVCKGVIGAGVGGVIGLGIGLKACELIPYVDVEPKEGACDPSINPYFRDLENGLKRMSRHLDRDASILNASVLASALLGCVAATLIKEDLSDRIFSVVKRIFE